MKRELDDWITGYLQYTSNTEPTMMYHLWSAISVIAAVLQRKCFLEWGTLTFYPNMYVVLVGPPAARKGTAMNMARPFLEQLSVGVAAEAITREALIRELNNSGSTEITSDGSMIFHASLTIWSQELTVFLGYQNQQLMSDLTDWYDCRDKWIYRTKHEGVDEIDGVYVNLFGATTPDLIKSTLPLDAIGGGLTSRMIFVHERNKGKVVPYPDLGPTGYELEPKLQSDLARIHAMNGRFRTNSAFMEKWVKWYPSQEGRHKFEDTRFEGYLERRANHVMKLSMIVNASRTEDMVITEGDLTRAIAILTETEENMASTFSGVGELSYSTVMEKISRDIVSNRTMLASEILRKYRSDVDKWRLDTVLETFSAQKRFKIISLPDGDIRIISVLALEKNQVDMEGNLLD